MRGADKKKMAASSAEVEKLKHHLSLLRDEYVKLQQKYVELERKYEILTASANSPSTSAVANADQAASFVSRLLKKVADLFGRELYSDITIILNGTQLRAHRFVLAARSEYWGVPSLADVDQLDISELAQDVAYALFKWVYTDTVDLNANEAFLLDLMKAASSYNLVPLVWRCETMLMSSVNVQNCIKFYTVAEEIKTDALKSHCSELISSHWDDFAAVDFAHMSAPPLYKMFKAKSLHPLHMAIRMRREDVVFLFLMEFDSKLSVKLNEMDKKGDLPLDLALREKQMSIARTLVSHRIDVNVRDGKGYTLLHKAVVRADEEAARFLIEHGASVNDYTPDERRGPLHLIANLNFNKTSDANMIEVVHLLLSKGADANLQDICGNTVLHTAIISQNEAVFSAILSYGTINLELLNEKKETVLWLALDVLQQEGQVYFAKSLVERGCSLESVEKDTGDSLLHRLLRHGSEDAVLFLCDSGAFVNHINKKGESPLHVACARGLSKAAVALLRRGANANLQTTSSTLVDLPVMFEGTVSEIDDEIKITPAVYRQTPLHVAIQHGHKNCIDAIIEHKNFFQRLPDSVSVIPNFNVLDSEGQSALGLALLMGFQSVAQRLLAGGASININNNEGLNLLHQSILFHEPDSALFLLESGVDATIKTPDNKSAMQLAIDSHMPFVVEALCERGVAVNDVDVTSDPPLWSALESGQEDISNILVRYNCDRECWRPGPDGCQQTLLHRAIDENNECSACFLIRSGCDVNVCRRPGPDGRGSEVVSDLQTPLHLACAWGLENVAQTLLEHQANVNIQDAEGKTPLHLAIVNQHVGIISSLIMYPGVDLAVKDKHGQTPFAVAMVTKNNKAAEAILKRQPTAAEQYNNKGLNFLHVAIQKGDIESVLFLLGINVNIHSRVQDHTQYTPLHLAVLSSSEMLVRNLLLAGANVNDLTFQKQSVLHLAASVDQAVICSILLENGVNFDALDDNQNNALHIAVQKGHLATIKVLLTESTINAEAVNCRGQNPLHVLCQHGKESAATIFELFMECMPRYPINKPDADGNTPLLLAYMNGNGALCRAIVRVGACLGSVNRHGISLFNYQVATKQLLYRLLDLLTKEPPWSEGDVCLECNAKFGIATRRHHCRHCGRLLCSKCSNLEMPILKFSLNKPVRVCEICFNVLTVGGC